MPVLPVFRYTTSKPGVAEDQPFSTEQVSSSWH